MSYSEYLQNEFYPCILFEDEFERIKYFRIEIIAGYVTEYDQVFEKYNLQRDGDDWQRIIQKLIQDNGEISFNELDFNSECSTFVLDIFSKNTQEKIANLIKDIYKDKNRLEAIIMEIATT